MGIVMEERVLLNEEERTEGLMVAVEADTYEEARRIAYARWGNRKEEILDRMARESVEDMLMEFFGR